MKLTILTLLGIFSCTIILAQTTGVRLHIIDEKSAESVPAVVVTKQDYVVAKTDSQGYCVIPADILQNSAVLIIKSTSHNPVSMPTKGLSSRDVLLTARTISLPETVVGNNKSTESVLRGHAKTIVDYDICNAGIILAAYNSKGGELIFLDHNWDTISYTKLAFRPEKLIRTCDDNLLVSSRFHLYSISYNGGGNLAVRVKFPINYLPLIQNCQQSLYGNHYYKYVNPGQFRSSYAMIPAGDSVMKLFYRITDRIAGKESYRDQKKIAFLETLAADGAVEITPTMMNAIRLNKECLDAAAVSILDRDLFTKSDSLLVFDFVNKRLRYFTPDGKQVKAVTLSLDDILISGVEIFKDNLTEKFYVANTDARYKCLQEIDMATGKLLANRITASRPFVSAPKIYNGRLYYMWQDNRSAQRMQLYAEY